MTVEFLKTVVIIFVVSAVTIFLLSKLKISPIVGFIISGALIGPKGLGLVGNYHIVEIFAEIGVILLLFVIGIELSPRKIFENKTGFIIGGALQVLIATFLSFLFLWALSVPYKEALFISLLISLSSTAIVLKILSDRSEVDTPHGQTIVGMLLFQDILAVIFLPWISFSGEISLKFVLLKFFAVFVSVLIILYGSTKVIPMLFFKVVNTRIRELFLLTVLLVCFGVAFLAHEIGLPLAFGAFLAGLAISESEYSHQATAEILPFKESFMALFFVAIGMMIDISFILSNIFLLLPAIVTVLIVKFLSGFVPVYFLSKNIRTAVLTGLGISQIGEFSFVLFLAGMSQNLLTAEIHNFFLAISVSTMLITPFIFMASSKFANLISGGYDDLKNLPRRIPKADIIIVGFGLNGQNIAKILKGVRIPYIALELNIATVKRMSELGEPIFFADASSREVLKKFGIKDAKLLVIAISDPVSTRKIVSIARSENPHIYIIVRTRYVSEVDELKKLGANEVIPEEFETSIAISERVMEYFRMPINLIYESIRSLRQDSYRILREFDSGEQKIFKRFEFLNLVDIETFVVEENSRVIDKTIAELELRSRTGVTIVAVQRGQNIFVNPSPYLVLKAGDILFLLGKEYEINRAVEFLSTKFYN